MISIWSIPTKMEHRKRDETAGCTLVLSERISPAEYVAVDPELKLERREWDEGKAPTERLPGGKTRLEDSQAREAIIKAEVVRYGSKREQGGEISGGR